jgi:hypothetical protein
MGSLDIKLPHWAALVIALVGIIITWVLQQEAAGTLVLPALAVTVLLAIQPILTWLSPSASPAMNRMAVARHDSLFPPALPDSPLPTRVQPTTNRPPPPPPKDF